MLRAMSENSGRAAQTSEERFAPISGTNLRFSTQFSKPTSRYIPMHRRLSLFIFLLPACSLAQNLVCDGILFWDSVDWERTDVVTYPTEKYVVTCAVRRYYGDRRDIREEFIRIDADNWLFNSYDTTGAYRYRHGRMAVDRLHPRIDTSLTFDPETYEELWHLDTTWRLRAEGFWLETDTAHYLWQGEYTHGQRQGGWVKGREIAPGIVDFRSLAFENGIIVEEKQLNLALTSDTLAAKAALAGTWMFCKGRDHQYVLKKWDGPRPEWCEGNHHGTSMLFFLENGAVQRCIPDGLVKMGAWQLSSSMELHIDWDDGSGSRDKIRSLIGFDLLLQPLD